MKRPKENAPLELLLETIAQERGLDLRGYKRGTLERRIRKRMERLKAKDYAGYLDLLRKRPAEVNQLLDAVLINVTRFFRDPPAWEFLRDQVVPGLLDRALSTGSLRLWCAGCATGEEAYSVAILIAEQLGEPSAHKIDIKIYATDNDEDALKIARNGKYSEEALELVPAPLRTKYFGGERGRTLVPKLRRMIIFGRSNLLANPPISHIHLLLCRNVLIYFDQVAQQHILTKLTRALEEGGVLFLGKSESLLRGTTNLHPLSAKWRIFQLREREGAMDKQPSSAAEKMAQKASDELHVLKAYQQSILETVEPGILIMDSRDQVITENEAARRLWQSSDNMTGKALKETALWDKCPELVTHLDESRATRPATIRFECKSPAGLSLSITIKPILSEGSKGQVGTLIHMEDVTPHNALQSTIEELETTTEELQSSNEELENTNEELQSTNEELETINEELQSSNEELETTNEELQSLNEELETTNAELQERSKQLDELNQHYGAMVERMPLPVLLVNADGSIHLFNSAAQKLLGFADPSAAGIRLDQLPLPTAMRRLLAEKHVAVVRAGRPEVLTHRMLETDENPGFANIHISPVLSDRPEHGVLIIFEPFPVAPASSDGKKAAAKTPPGNGRTRSRNNKPAKASRR